MAKTKHILLAAEKLKLSDELSYPALGQIKDTQEKNGFKSQTHDFQYKNC